MNDPIQPEDRTRAQDEPGGVGVYETRADETASSSSVNTYERPATTARSGPNALAILLLLLILALLAYAAFQVIR